jgi:hypothetical protein
VGEIHFEVQADEAGPRGQEEPEREVTPRERAETTSLLFLRIKYKENKMANNQASDKIEAAINEGLKSNEGHVEGDLLIEWVVIAYVTNPDQEEGSGYPMFFSNGDIPTYRARGLLETALLKLHAD